MQTAQLSPEGVSRRRFLRGAGALGAAGVVGGLTGCGNPGPGGKTTNAKPTISTLSAPKKPITLSMWHGFGGPDAETMNRIVKRISNGEPNLTVNVATQADMGVKVRTAAQAGKLPHVGVFNMPIQLGADGIVLPLDDLAKALKLDEADFVPGAWRTSIFKDKRYAIPLDVQPFAYWWNKSLFAQGGIDENSVPTPADAFTEALESITEKTRQPGLMIPTAGPGGTFFAANIWSTFFYQFGGSWTNDDFSEATFNSDAGVKAIEYMAKLMDLKISPRNVQSDSEVAAFTANRNASMLNGVWQTNRLKADMGANLGAGPTPHLFGPGTAAGSQGLVLFNTKMSEEERQAAYYFLGKMSDSSLAWADSGNIPARKSVRAQAQFGSMQPQANIASDLDQCGFVPPTPIGDGIMFATGGAGDAVLAALTGKQTPKAALDDAANRYTALFKASKTKYGY